MQTRQPRNIAARAGRWSAQHRKTAIWGWLAFVAVAVFVGSSVGTKTLDNDHNGVGESGRASETLAASFPENAGETVLVQSATQTADSPAFRSVVRDVEQRIAALRHAEDIKGPYDPANRGQISRDGLSALAHLQDPRRHRPRREAGDRGPRDRRRGPEGEPRLRHRGVRRRQRRQGAEQGLRGRLPQGRAHLAADHAGDPGDRLRRPGRRGGAADPRPDGGVRDDRPDRPDQPHRRGRRGDQLGGAADRARRRRRLLDVLPAARTRGARRGQIRARPRSTRPPRPRDGRCSSPASR